MKCTMMHGSTNIKLAVKFEVENMFRTQKRNYTGQVFYICFTARQVMSLITCDWSCHHLLHVTATTSAYIQPKCRVPN
jgi:hypothetical protein